MKKKLLFALLIITLFACEIHAETLTLQESINKTLANHPDIKSFVLKVSQSQKNYDSSYAETRPQINLHSEYNPLQTYTLPINGSFRTLDEDGWGIGVSLKQKIWDFAKTSSIIQASKVDEEISKLTLQDAKALMVYKVKTFYGLMVVQKEAIAVRQKDLQTKAAYYAQAQALVIEGLRTEADASRFLSSVYVAEDNLTTAMAAYEKTKTSLSLLMGKEIEKDTSLEFSAVKNEYLYDDNLQNNILDSNYQIKIGTQTIDKNRLLYKAAKGSQYGSFDIIASYNYFDTLNSYDAKLIGITFNMPLYSGGKINIEKQKSQLGIQTAHEQKKSKILSLTEEIGTLLIDIKKYNKTIEAKQAQQSSANKTKKVIEARYKEGLATYIEILDANSLILNAELGILEAYYSRSIAINRIDYLKGKIS